MKILHTADWHLGQLFYEYDRTYEHQHFLNWMRGTLSSENIEALLISGDIFDLSNPSAASIKMFYTFLNQAVKANSCPADPEVFNDIFKSRQSRKIGPFKKEYGNPYLFRNIMTDICPLQSGKAGIQK